MGLKKSKDVQEYLFQKLATSGEHVMYKNCSECQNKTKKNTTIYVHIMFSWCSELSFFMNNLSSYCGLVDAKIRASDIDLPVINGWFHWTLLIKSILDEKVIFSLSLLLSKLRLFLPHCTVFAAEGEICEIVLFTFANPLESFSGSKSKVNVSYIFFHFIFEFWCQAFGTTQQACYTDL